MTTFISIKTYNILQVKYSRLLALFLYAMISFHSNAQSGSIKGRVYNQINNEPIAYATVVIDSIINTISDENGDYVIKDLTQAPIM